METEIIRAIDDIIQPKTDRARFMDVAWKKLLEIKSAGLVDSLKFGSHNRAVLDEIDKRFASDFKILSEDDTFDIKKDFLEKFAKLEVLEGYFGFDFNDIDSYTFEVYKQFKEKISEYKEYLKENEIGDLSDEIEFEIGGLLDGESFILSFEWQEWQDSLEEQHKELKYSQESFEKNRQLDKLFEEYRGQIEQSISAADTEMLKGFVVKAKESFKLEKNSQKLEICDDDLYRRFVDCANSSQDRQLLKIAENIDNKGLTDAALSKVKNKDIITNYIGEKFDDELVVGVAKCENEFEYNTNKRKKLHLYNPTHWGQIYRLSRERKQITNKLATAKKNFEEKGMELLKSPIAKSIYISNKGIFRDLINKKKEEMLQEAQNTSYNSLAFSDAAVVAKEQTQQINSAKQAEIQQRLQQQKDKSVSIQMQSSYDVN